MFIFIPAALLFYVHVLFNERTQPIIPALINIYVYTLFLNILSHLFWPSSVEHRELWRIALTYCTLGPQGSGHDGRGP